MRSYGKAMALGALVGGLLGGISRPLVVIVFWIQGDRPIDSQVESVAVMSAGMLGLLIGAVGGLVAAVIPIPVAGPLLGALVAGCMALFSSLFTFFLLCMGTWQGGPRQVDLTLYWIMMTLTGFLPAGVGGLVGGLVGGTQQFTERSRYRRYEDDSFDDDDFEDEERDFVR